MQVLRKACEMTIALALIVSIPILLALIAGTGLVYHDVNGILK